MKRRLTAYVLTMAILTALIPPALADDVSLPNTSTDTVSAISAAPDLAVLTAEESIDGYTFVDLEEYEIPEDTEVIVPEPIAEAAPTDAVLESIDPQICTRSAPSEDETNTRLASATTKTTAFTTYGEQLGSIGLVASDTNVIWNLGDILTSLYSGMKKEILKGETSIYFLGDLDTIKDSGLWFELPNTSKAERYQILNAIMWIVYRSLDYDLPQMFYSNCICSAQISYESNVVYLSIIPGYGAGMETVALRQEWKTQLDAKVSQLVRQSRAYPRAYDKIKFFHDWLCENNAYNNAAAASGSYIRNVSSLPWSSVGALLGSTSDTATAPVCEGYARAMQLLCSRVGIQAPVITSDVHMWNNVHYGAYWTGLDATWDDTSYGVIYNYFMKDINDSDNAHALDDKQFLYFAYPVLTQIDNGAILPFYDKMSWETEYVQWVYDNGYMNGNTCVNFGAAENLTRAQFAQILYNIAGRPEVTYTARFSDVPETAWYASACIWAAEQNITNGNGTGIFSPETAISREQIVTMLFRRSNTTPVAYDLSEFSDASNISRWASDGMRWAVSTGIISGYGDGILAPKDSATRAQTAKIITISEEINDDMDGEVPED